VAGLARLVILRRQYRFASTWRRDVSGVAVTLIDAAGARWSLLLR
jgi:hypothetical protein